MSEGPLVMQAEDAAQAQEILREGMQWLKHRYAGILSEGPPDPVYTEAMRGGLLLLLDMRLPGVPEEIEAWIEHAEPPQLLLFVASLLEPGGLYRICRQILADART